MTLSTSGQRWIAALAAGGDQTVGDLSGRLAMPRPQAIGGPDGSGADLLRGSATRNGTNGRLHDPHRLQIPSVNDAGFVTDTPLDALARVRTESYRPILSERGAELVGKSIAQPVINIQTLKQFRDKERREGRPLDSSIARVIENLEREALDHTLEFLSGPDCPSELRNRVCEYLCNTRMLIERSIEAPDYRKFIEDSFEIRLQGSEEVRAALEAHPRSVIVFNHHQRTPEINGISTINASEQHDMTPVLSQILTAAAFRDGAGVAIERYGKPYYREDPFYRRGRDQFGFRQISDEGVQALAGQFQRTFGRGAVPTICPEAGMRMLGVFRSGGVVAAALAGAEQIIAVAENPWISLLHPEKVFVHAGNIPITGELREAIREGDNSVEAKSLAQKLAKAAVEDTRRVIGQTVLNSDYFSAAYKTEVRRNVFPH